MCSPFEWPTSLRKAVLSNVYSARQMLRLLRTGTVMPVVRDTVVAKRSGLCYWYLAQSASTELLWDWRWMRRGHGAVACLLVSNWSFSGFSAVC